MLLRLFIEGLVIHLFRLISPLGMMFNFFSISFLSISIRFFSEMKDNQNVSIYQPRSDDR